jgi:hypothetical protein
MSGRGYKLNFNISYKRFSTVDYAVLYNALSICDWSSLHNERSLDAAVDRLNVAVTQATDLAVPCGYIKKHKYTAYFSGKLKAYIKRKNYFYRRYKTYKADCFYGNISFLPQIS